MSFQNTTTATNGLSDFHTKSKPTEIAYRNYMKSDIDAFQGELKLKLQAINNYESFESAFLSKLNKHAPLTKTLARGNHAP